MDQESFAHWDGLYNGDDALPWTVQGFPPEVRTLVNQLPAGGRMIDLGCGSGELTATLAKEGFSIIGFDGSAAAIARAGEISDAPTANFVHSSIFSIEGNNEFDGVIMYSVLHHIQPKRWPAVVELIASLLKPDGLGLITTYASRGQANVEPRVGRYGNTMYHSSPSYLVDCFSSNLRVTAVLDSRLGVRRNHPAICLYVANQSAE